MVAQAKSTTDQFAQALSVAQSLEFNDIESAGDGVTFNTIAAGTYDETQVIFPDGVFSISANCHSIRLTTFLELNLYFWPELDTGSGFAKLTNVTTVQIIGTADDNEVQPIKIFMPYLTVSNGDKLRFRMEADLLVNSGIVFIDNTKTDPAFPGLAPSFSFSALKL